jgi:medium-chain acyl-[acyl-carrier-protein] hydrolase
MGALIGFELARLLRQRGGPMPAHLFLSGCRAPQVPKSDPPTFDLPEDEFVAEVKRLNGTPKDVLAHPELMKLLVPLLRADFQVCQSYLSPVEPPRACPITAFGGLQDSEIPRDQIAAWKEQTDAKFTLRMLPGDHFFLHAHEPLIIRAVASELLALVP